MTTRMTVALAEVPSDYLELRGWKLHMVPALEEDFHVEVLRVDDLDLGRCFVPSWAYHLRTELDDVELRELALKAFSRGDTQFRAAGTTALLLGGEEGLRVYLDGAGVWGQPPDSALVDEACKLAP